MSENLKGMTSMKCIPSSISICTNISLQIILVFKIFLKILRIQYFVVLFYEFKSCVEVI